MILQIRQSVIKFTYYLSTFICLRLKLSHFLKQSLHDLTIKAVSLFKSWKERKWDTGEKTWKKTEDSKVYACSDINPGEVLIYDIMFWE